MSTLCGGRPACPVLLRAGGSCCGQMSLKNAGALSSDLANRLTHPSCGSPRYHKSNAKCAVSGVIGNA